jgi:hypothetical protein
MSAKRWAMVIFSTACVSLLTTVVATATITPAVKLTELTAAVALIAFLLRSNRSVVLAFVIAAAVVIANQMLLSYGYLTFLNAGQAFSASSFGAVPASVLIGAVVAATTATAFSIRRVWAYVTVIVLLVAVTWPTSLSRLSI